MQAPAPACIAAASTCPACNNPACTALLAAACIPEVSITPTCITSACSALPAPAYIHTIILHAWLLHAASILPSCASHTPHLGGVEDTRQVCGDDILPLLWLHAHHQRVACDACTYTHTCMHTYAHNRTRMHINAWYKAHSMPAPYTVTTTETLIQRCGTL